MTTAIPEPAERSTFSIRRDWPLMIAWPIIGLLTLLIGGVARMLAGQDVAWLPLLWSTISWAEWLLIVPWIIHLTRRFPLRSGHSSRWLVHAGGATSVWLLHSALVYLATWVMYGELVPGSGMTLKQDLTFRLPVWLLYDVLVYLTTSGATAALDLHRILAARAVRQAQLHARVAEAELELMQMQVQPEFILRTLAAARQFSISEPRRCEALVGRLADVLRSSLETLGSDRLTIDAELRHVRGWLAVDALRADRRVKISVDCDPESLSREIPKFVITDVVSAVVSATPEHEPISISIDAAGIGDVFALRLRIESEGVAAASEKALREIEQRRRVHGTQGWTVEVEELGPRVLALTFDQSGGEPSVHEPGSERFGLEGGLIVGA